MKQQPTTQELERVHSLAGLSGSLREAMANPILARCLEITAVAWRAHLSATLPAASSPPTARQQQPITKPCAPDFKQRSAGDRDDD